MSDPTPTPQLVNAIPPKPPGMLPGRPSAPIQDADGCNVGWAIVVKDRTGDASR